MTPARVATGRRILGQFGSPGTRDVAPQSQRLHSGSVVVTFRAELTNVVDPARHPIHRCVVVSKNDVWMAACRSLLRRKRPPPSAPTAERSLSATASRP